MRVLVCGDRNWTDKGAIELLLRSLPEGSTLIHGCCRGADMIAHEIAKEIGMEIVTFPAAWDRFGKKAGPIRNERMLLEGKPDRVVAFHDDLRRSKGTAHMVKIAMKAGIYTAVYPEPVVGKWGG